MHRSPVEPPRKHRGAAIDSAACRLCPAALPPLLHTGPGTRIAALTQHGGQSATAPPLPSFRPAPAAVGRALSRDFWGAWWEQRSRDRRRPPSAESRERRGGGGRGGRGQCGRDPSGAAGSREAVALRPAPERGALGPAQRCGQPGDAPPRLPPPAGIAEPAWEVPGADRGSGARRDPGRVEARGAAGAARWAGRGRGPVLRERGGGASARGRRAWACSHGDAAHRGRVTGLACRGAASPPASQPGAAAVSTRPGCGGAGGSPLHGAGGSWGPIGA